MTDAAHSVLAFPAFNRRDSCADCRWRARCLSAGLEGQDLARFERIVVPRLWIRRGAYAYFAGSDSASLFAIRSGSFKASASDREGRRQILDFYLAGDLLGLDAIATGQHGSDAMALEDSRVCRIPLAGLQHLCEEVPPLARNVLRLLGHEIAREHEVMLLLGTMRSDERVAEFLITLSDRLLARGYSPSHLVLRMTRHDIGSHVGLSLETVSRTLARLHRAALIAVDGSDIRIIDRMKLCAITRGAARRVAAAAGVPARDRACGAGGAGAPRRTTAAAD
jgi:CRP/FNR family transcriptional regulator